MGICKVSVATVSWYWPVGICKEQTNEILLQSVISCHSSKVSIQLLIKTRIINEH